jgi:hypothetical protein
MTTDDIIKPAVDDWSYRAITLANGVTAMLISDPEADKASASMDVRFKARGLYLCEQRARSRDNGRICSTVSKHGRASHM